MKIVKVARVGEMVKEVAINDNNNVQAALIAADLEVRDNELIFLNHVAVSRTSNVCNKDIIILETKKIDAENKRILDVLFEEELLDPDDYPDEDGGYTDTPDYSYAYEENKDVVDKLIIACR